MGIRGGIARNTLANANKVRDWRIYADFAQAPFTSWIAAIWISVGCIASDSR
jgi:hypothetical protein